MVAELLRISGSAGMAIVAVSAGAARSQPTMTVRRGYRPASPDSNGPPISAGSSVTAYAAPDAAADPVSANTNRLSATRAS